MANYDYITSTGVVVPDTATLRSDVEAEWRSALGNDVPLTPETPQGVMITAEVEARDAMVRNNAELANQINPDIAGGIFLDGIWALTRGSRRGATRSRLSSVIFSGVPGTIIPASSIATVSGSGARFRTIVTIILDALGIATSSMEAVEPGPITAPSGSLTEIASSVLGWETVTNPFAAELGQSRETDVSSRRRRRQTLALQSVGMPESIISRLYDVDGVTSLSFRENIANSPITIDGITLVAHSIYACVDGGSDYDVALALLQSKAVGPDYNGTVTVEVTEPSSGQVYIVKFSRPVRRTFRARVTAKKSPLDLQTIIPNAIELYATGELEGDSGLTVNQHLSSFELAGAINQVEPRIFVTKVETSEDGLTWSSNDVNILLNQIAVLPKSAVQVILV